MFENNYLQELAIATWRLEKWLNNLDVKRKMAAKSAIRTYNSFLNASGVEIKDPIGTHFDPGLALEVLNNEAEDRDEDELIIVETISPYIYLNGELLSVAKVIIGSAEKQSEAATFSATNETSKGAQEPSKKIKQKHRKNKAKKVAILRKKVNKKHKRKK